MRGTLKTLTVKLKRVRQSADPLPVPRYHSALAAGMDLRADIEGNLVLQPLERRAVPTGWALELPPGFEAQVRPRSGLALKEGITCLNSPGTIDADYRGELRVILINLSSSAVTLHRGDRIAQLVVSEVCRAVAVDVA
jgi:dUTP pyrophosphatase